MNAQQFFFAINSDTNEVECFATKFLPASNCRPARFEYWKMNGAFEKIEKSFRLSWDYECTRQVEQLKNVLGEKWAVLEFHEACTIIRSHFKHAAQ